MILDPRGGRRFSPPNPKTLKIFRFFDVRQFFEPKIIEKPKLFQCFLALSPEASGLKPKKQLKTIGFLRILDFGGPKSDDVNDGIALLVERPRLKPLSRT